MKRWLLLLALTQPAMLFGQFDRGGAMTYESRHRHSALVEVPFLDHDVSIGAFYRYSISGERFLGLFGTFHARPYARAVLVQAGSHFYFQLQEYRFLLAAGLDKKFWINNRWDVFLTAGAGLTFVDYRGTGEGTFLGHKIEKKEGLTPLVRGGLSYKFSRYVFVRFGYQYSDARTSDGHRVYVGVGGQL